MFTPPTRQNLINGHTLATDTGARSVGAEAGSRSARATGVRVVIAASPQAADDPDDPAGRNGVTAEVGDVGDAGACCVVTSAGRGWASGCSAT